MTEMTLLTRGFRPLKIVRHEKKERGVVGFFLCYSQFKQPDKLYISAIYEIKHKIVYGEPLVIPGFTVYRKPREGREPGIYNMKGERVALEFMEYGEDK